MAVFTKTEICNIALGHLGVSKEVTTAQLAASSNAESSACNLYWARLLERILRDYRWPFATKQAALFWQEDNPTDEWSYAYQYPAECMFFRRIVGAGREDQINADERIPYLVTYGLHTADRDGIAEAQALSGSGNLILNGVWADLGTALVYTAQEGRLLTIYGVSDESGVTFTPTGTDRDGAALTESITGPTAGATVTSTGYYMTLATMAGGGATTGNVEVGAAASYGKEIYCDEADAVGEYTLDLSAEIDRFPVDFGMALSWLLAAYIATRLTVGKSNLALRREAMAEYRIEVSNALANAGNEMQLKSEPASSLEKARA